MTSLVGSVASPSNAAEQGGATWGRYLSERPVPRVRLSTEEAIGRLVALLARLGFEPQIEYSDGEPLVRLRRRPYRSRALQRPEVACGVHLGVMGGALAESGGTAGVSALELFVTPGLCLAHLSIASA